MTEEETSGKAESTPGPTSRPPVAGPSTRGQDMGLDAHGRTDPRGGRGGTAPGGKGYGPGGPQMPDTGPPTPAEIEVVDETLRQLREWRQRVEGNKK